LGSCAGWALRLAGRQLRTLNTLPSPLGPHLEIQVQLVIQGRRAIELMLLAGLLQRGARHRRHSGCTRPLRPARPLSTRLLLENLLTLNPVDDETFSLLFWFGLAGLRRLLGESHRVFLRIQLAPPQRNCEAELQSIHLGVSKRQAHPNTRLGVREGACLNLGWLLLEALWPRLSCPRRSHTGMHQRRP
jgi:hypothetical protein